MSRTFTLIAIVSGAVALLAGNAFAQAPASDSIKVHGAWTIEVRNPDGSLAGRHEFHNALTPLGQTRLVSFLTGNSTAMFQFWSVVLHGTVCAGVSCNLLEAPAVVPGTSPDGLLTVEAVGSPEPNAIRLRGSATAVADGTISTVSTHRAVVGGSFSFSERTLPQPVQLVAGQVITVTVLISFS